jgi:hypothetical protein
MVGIVFREEVKDLVLREIERCGENECVAGYALVTEQHFDGVAGDPQFDLVADQGVRHRVVVMLEPDVVVEA